MCYLGCLLTPDFFWIIKDYKSKVFVKSWLFFMSIGVGAVTALVEFGEVWTPFIFCAFQDLFGGPQSLKRCVCGLPKPL